jgi:SAM-dependent methyltransferase
MEQINYPLGHTQQELIRLDKQAKLLHDPRLDQLAANAKSCLEIGCGSGSNLPLLLQANPDLHYTGIDISPHAINTASARYNGLKQASFHYMDAAMIDINDKFDLIFTKLVLWATGEKLTRILREVNRLLSSDGLLYTLEPCNHLIQLHPPKPNAQAWMQHWDNTMRMNGFNPHIGSSIAHQLKLAGFNNIQAHFFPVAATGYDQNAYMEIINNLKGFYMGPAADQFNLDNTDHLNRLNALKELDTYDDQSFVMDALYVTHATI